jgi:DNA-binding transcriptional ArsR family regulator
MNKRDFTVLESTALESDIRVDATDRAILLYLLEHESATVSELEKAVARVSRTVIFYRLLTFKGAGLVTSSRKSRNVVNYALSPQVKAAISQ